MDTSCLYLVLDDREIFAAVVFRDHGKEPVQKDSCRISWPGSSGKHPGNGQFPAPAPTQNQAENQVQHQDLNQEKSSRQEEAGEKDPFALAMEEIASRLDLSSCTSAALFFPTHWASFRTLSFPFSSPAKVRQILPLELEGLLLPDEDSPVFDFYSLESAGNDFPMFVGAMPQGRLKSCVSVLSSFGLSVDMAAPLGSALAQGFLDIQTLPAQQDGSHGLLVIREGNRLVFVLIVRGCVHMIRSRPVREKLEPDMVCARTVEILAGACQEFGLDQELSVYLFLDGEDDSEFSGQLSTALAEVSVVNEVVSCTNWKHWPLFLSLDKARPGMLQFIKPRHRARAILGKYTLGFGICAALLAGIFFIFFLGAMARNASCSRAIQKLDARARTLFLETFPGTSRIQDPYLQMKANVGAAMKKNGGRQDNGRLPGAGAVLDELSQTIDSSMDVVISRFLLREGKLILAGTTNDFNNVDKIQTLLESSALFKKVDISGASADKQGNRVNFRFVIEIQGG